MYMPLIKLLFVIAVTGISIWILILLINRYIRKINK